MNTERLEAAVSAGEDPRQHARALSQLRDAVLSGSTLPSSPRTVIGASWQRMRQLGVDPECGAQLPALCREDLEERRLESGLAEALPILLNGLVGLAEQAGHIMIVVDADGRVLWRDGSSAVRRRADWLGCTDGADWREDVVGTNAIGTALVVQRPVQVFSAEHYARSLHPWTCAAAPLHDPRNGRLLGVVDISGPAPTVHATTLALVDAVARLAEAQMRMKHMADLERLRTVALPTLMRVTGRALVTDPHGWVAAASGLAPAGRIALPRRFAAGRAWLAAFGGCEVEPLPGGWLVRLTDTEANPAATRVVLDVSKSRSASLTITGLETSWRHELTPRHAEMFYILCRHRNGRSAAELASDLFGDPSRGVTVRAEMSRLRKAFGGILETRPYRFAEALDVAVIEPAGGHQALPYSRAPGVRANATTL